MDAKTASELQDRFVRAIKKSFKPCPLIGPKWFLPNPPGVAADYQFAGCNKLSKAMGMNPKIIVANIIKHLNLSDMQVAIEVTADHKINLKFGAAPAAKTEK